MFFSLAAKAQDTLLVDETFNKSGRNWEVNANGVLSDVKKGKFVIKNFAIDDRWITYNINNLNTKTEDYSIEIKIKQIRESPDVLLGLVLSAYDDNKSYILFLINSIGQLYIDNHFKDTAHVMVNRQNVGVINQNYEYNVLQVIKTSNILSYYVNSRLVYQNFDNKYYQHNFGFYLENRAKMAVDYIKIGKFPTKINVIENANAFGEKIKLSNKVNTLYEEYSPKITPDGKTLYIVRDDYPKNENGDENVWFSKLNQNNEWGQMQDIGFPINNEGHNFVISGSPDNNSLLIGNTYNKDGSKKKEGISVSYRTKKGWSVPKSLEIEDYYSHESFVGFSMGANNKTLIMALKRKEGMGSLDLYVSFLKTNNTWSAPQHLGDVINSAGVEDDPFLAADNKTIYFASNGHLGYGSRDIFVSKRLDNTWIHWSKPKNLGPKINTVGYDTGFFLSAEGDEAYFSSNYDIWKIKNVAIPDPVVLIAGVVYNKKTNSPMGAAIRYYDLSSNQELGIARSNPTTGAYKIVLPYGKHYSFLGKKIGFYPISENIDLSKIDRYKEVEKNLYMVPIEKGGTIRLNNIFFEFNKATLKPKSLNELNRLYHLMIEKPKIKIQISGHTDNVGASVYNLQLSKKRAEVVVRFLIKKGVDANRLSSKGYGETKPLLPNNSEKNRTTNRRVEFKIF